MKQPLVECDILVEVASDRLTAERGDFLIVYFTDPDRRRAIAVKTFQPNANGAGQKPARLALPAPKKLRAIRQKPANLKIKRKTKQRIYRQVPDTAIEWRRALGQQPRPTVMTDHIRQIVFDRCGDFISYMDLCAQGRTSTGNVFYAMKALIASGWVVRTMEHGRKGFRLTSDGAAYLENFRRRAVAS